MSDLKIVEENGWVLEYVKNQTPEICLVAVKHKGYALQFVKEQTPEICFIAIKQDKDVQQFVREEFKFLSKEEYEGLSLKEIQAKVPELFL